MHRRNFIAGLGILAAFGPNVAGAQLGGRIRRIGIPLFSKQDQRTIQPFIQALESLGYVDGKNIALEYHDAEGRADRLPVVASEIVSLEPDVIFAFGGDVAPVIKNATAKIPVVVEQRSRAGRSRAEPGTPRR